MKKILALCCSDILGIPALLQLKHQGSLAAIAITDKIARQFIPILLSCGFSVDEIHILSKKSLEEQLLELINTRQPDALFVLTFSWMIPGAVLSRLVNRCINFHFGLLPKYKGAEPVFWQLKNGDKTGGIYIHIMTGDLDSGPMLAVEELPIYAGETYGLYAQRLGALVAQAAIKIANNLDTIRPLPMVTTNEPAMFLKAPAPADLTINWQQQTAAEIECLVNAANPRYGGAATTIRQMLVRLLEVSPVEVSNPNPVAPGTIVYADANYGLIVACLNQQYLKLNIVHIQEGFLSGSKLFSLGFLPGEVFI